MNAPPPKSVGLGGDGDEISALEIVEATFGVKLDHRDAPNWYTAGNVYRSLCKALPASEADHPNLWDRFAAALCSETGVDPKRIRPESTLLSPTWSRLINVGTALGMVIWIVIAIAAVIVLGTLLF